MKYRVHRASVGSVQASVKLDNGEKAQAIVSVYEVELIPVDHAGSTVIHRYLSDEAVAAAKAKYVPNVLVEIAEEDILIVEE